MNLRLTVVGKVAYEFLVEARLVRFSCWALLYFASTPFFSLPITSPFLPSVALSFAEPLFQVVYQVFIVTPLQYRFHQST